MTTKHATSDLLGYLLDNVSGFRQGRLPSLYSDFWLQRTSNPDGYSANCTTWLRAFCKAARNGRLSFDLSSSSVLSVETGPGLLQALETKQLGRPLALGAVIEEGLTQGRLLLLDDFLKSQKSLYERDSFLDPRWLLSWAFRRLSVAFDTVNAPVFPTKQFVLLDNVESTAKEIQTRIKSRPGRIDNIYSMSGFTRIVESVLGIPGQVSALDLTILLRYLSRDQCFLKHNASVVVIKDKDDSSEQLSEEQMTVGNLRQSTFDLQDQIDVLSSAIVALSEKAKSAVAEDKRAAAIAALRSRRLKIQVLSSRTDCLAKVQETLNSIEQANDQVTMVKLMKASTNVLESLHVEAGDAQQVVDRLKDEVAKVDEISEIISTAAYEDTVGEEDEIESELEALLQDENRSQELLRSRELAALKTPQDEPSQSEGSKENSGGALQSASHVDVAHGNLIATGT